MKNTLIQTTFCPKIGVHYIITGFILMLLLTPYRQLFLTKGLQVLQMIIHGIMTWLIIIELMAHIQEFQQDGTLEVLRVNIYQMNRHC